MKKLLVLLVFSGVLFGGGAAVSYLIRQAIQSQVAESEGETSGPDGERTPKKPPTQKQPLPVGERTQPITAPEMFRMQEALGEQQAKLQVLQTQINQEHDRIQLMHKDLDSRHQELEGEEKMIRDLMEKAEMQIKELEKQKLELQQKADSFDKEKEQFEKRNQLGDANRQANAKLLAGVIVEMDSAKAADLIEDLASRPEGMDQIIDVLSSISEQAITASVLSEVQDNRLRNEIVQAFLNRKTPGKDAKRR